MTAGTRFWPDELSPAERRVLDPGPGRLDRRPDLVVVGGGIMGVAIAASCRQAGLGSVLLIEADQLGAGATGGAAGLLQPDPHQGTDPALLVELGRSSLARWRRLQAEVPHGVGLLDLDWIGLAPHPAGFVADPPPGVRWLDADDVHRLVPDLAAPTTAALIPGQARLNPLRALARLAGQLPDVATGVAATAITVRGHHVIALSTTAGTIHPGGVVFATGVPPAVDGLDPTIPADVVKGHLLVTEPLSVRLPASLAPVGTQLEDGRLLVGGTLDVDDASPDVSERVISGLFTALTASLPAAAGARVTHRWCCWRPHHPGGLPVIDQVPGVENAWMTSGHYRTGILMAPATGGLLAEWIGSGRRPDLATGFSMARFTADPA
jgi:glycine oxidase